MIKKRIVCLILALSLSLVVGCASNNSEKNQENNKAEGKELTETKNVNLTMWETWTKTEDVLNSTIDAYTNENSNISIDLVMVPGEEYWTKLSASIASKTVPEIGYFHNREISVYREALEPYPKDIFPIEEMKKDYYAFEEAYMIDGEWYFFPGGMMDGQIYCNVDMFKEKGLEVPESWTWDEFANYAKKLTSYKDDGTVDVVGCSIKDFGRFLWMDFFSQSGGIMYDENGKMQLNSEAGKKATEFFATLFQDLKIEDEGSPSCWEAFITGKAAMLHSRGFYENNIIGADVKFDWAVAPIPTPESDSVVTGRNNYECFHVVFKGAPDNNKTEAFKFLKYLYDNDEYHIVQSTSYNRVPSKISIWDNEAVTSDTVLSVSLKTAPKSIFYGDVPNAGLDNVEYLIDKIRMGEDPMEVLDEAQKLAEEAMIDNPAQWIVENQWREGLGLK